MDNNIKRPIINDTDIHDAIISIEDRLKEKIEKKGNLGFVSHHEALGVITEEYYELLKSVHKNKTHNYVEELMDVALSCIYGLASYRAALRDQRALDLEYEGDELQDLLTLYSFAQGHQLQMLCPSFFDNFVQKEEDLVKFFDKLVKRGLLKKHFQLYDYDDSPIDIELEDGIYYCSRTGKAIEEEDDIVFYYSGTDKLYKEVDKFYS